MLQPSIIAWAATQNSWSWFSSSFLCHCGDKKSKYNNKIDVPTHELVNDPMILSLESFTGGSPLCFSHSFTVCALYSVQNPTQVFSKPANNSSKAEIILPVYTDQFRYLETLSNVLQLVRK